MPTSRQKGARVAVARAQPARDVASIVKAGLASTSQPLDGATRGFMEGRFGWDFSQIRVHADPAAARSALALGARAYTVGNDIVFGSGRLSSRELARAIAPGARARALDATGGQHSHDRSARSSPRWHRGGSGPPGQPGAVCFAGDTCPERLRRHRRRAATRASPYPDLGREVRYRQEGLHHGPSGGWRAGTPRRHQGKDRATRRGARSDLLSRPCRRRCRGDCIRPVGDDPAEQSTALPHPG